MAWPNFYPRWWKTRSSNRWQHRLKREHPTCTERQWLTKECGWKGGDSGNLAEEDLASEMEKNCLTPAGLLMEGHIARNQGSSMPARPVHPKDNSQNCLLSAEASGCFAAFGHRASGPRSRIGVYHLPHLGSASARSWAMPPKPRTLCLWIPHTTSLRGQIAKGGNPVETTRPADPGQFRSIVERGAKLRGRFHGSPRLSVFPKEPAIAMLDNQSGGSDTSLRRRRGASRSSQVFRGRGQPPFPAGFRRFLSSPAACLRLRHTTEQVSFGLFALLLLSAFLDSVVLHLVLTTRVNGRNGTLLEIPRQFRGAAARRRFALKAVAGEIKKTFTGWSP